MEYFCILSGSASYLVKSLNTFSTSGLLSPSLLVGLVWSSLPDRGQISRASSKAFPHDALRVHKPNTERRPCRCCWDEVLCDVVKEATALCDYGRAAVHMQFSGSGDGGFDFQLLMLNSWIHGQHHIGMLKALSNEALDVWPTVFPIVSWEEGFVS